MTSATRPFFPPLFQPRSETVATGGQTRPHAGPIFIQDAVTPWRGETLLLALLRADIERANQSDD